MKKHTYKSLAIIALGSFGLVACNPLSNMTKRASEVSYSVTPNPLELHNDSIEVTIEGNIPPKFFNEKVSVVITPTLQFEGGEASYEPLTLVGEQSEIEGQKINYEKGGSFSYNDKIAYQEGMDQAKLMAVAVGQYKGKEKAFDPVQIATGTIITPTWAQEDDQAMVGADKFERVVELNDTAVINYLVNSAYVRSSELSDSDMDSLKNFIKEKADNDMFKFTGVEVVAYASPEGELSLNENLANDRAGSAANTVQKILRRNGVDAAKAENFYTKQGKGEDWQGFKTKMQASDIKDKDLILRVLQMYEDKAKREQEIRNLSETFEVIKEKILPELRRSIVVVQGEKQSFSDEKIAEFASSNPDTLSQEELLYAATLTEDLDEKLAIYETYVKLYPNDWRGSNNIGYIYVQQNKMEEAKAQFDKANSIDSDNPVVSNNLGVYERSKGNDDKAMEYFLAAEGAGPEVGSNLGYQYISRGDYVAASSSYGDTKSFNAALAQTLNKENDKAIQTLNESPDASTARGYYLKAIIGARKNDVNMVTTNLKSAVAEDSSLKEKAKTDAEFAEYSDNAEFQAIVE